MDIIKIQDEVKRISKYLKNFNFRNLDTDFPNIQSTLIQEMAILNEFILEINIEIEENEKTIKKEEINIRENYKKSKRLLEKSDLKELIEKEIIEIVSENKILSRYSKSIEDLKKLVDSIRYDIKSYLSFKQMDLDL